MSGPVLGIIVSQFPELHETFIVRELSALTEAGLPVRIYSLKRCRDRIVHPDAQRLVAQTTYVAWDDPVVWVAGLGQLVRHPVAAARGLAWVLRYHGWPPATLARGLIVWLQALQSHKRRKICSVMRN